MHFLLIEDNYLTRVFEESLSIVVVTIRYWLSGVGAWGEIPPRSLFHYSICC